MRIDHVDHAWRVAARWAVVRLVMAIPFVTRLNNSYPVKYFWWKSVTSINSSGRWCQTLSIEAKLESSHDKKEIESRARSLQELSVWPTERLAVKNVLLNPIAHFSPAQGCARTLETCAAVLRGRLVEAPRWWALDRPCSPHPRGTAWGLAMPHWETLWWPSPSMSGVSLCGSRTYGQLTLSFASRSSIIRYLLDRTLTLLSIPKATHMLCLISG